MNWKHLKTQNNCSFWKILLCWMKIWEIKKFVSKQAAKNKLLNGKLELRNLRKKCMKIYFDLSTIFFWNVVIEKNENENEDLVLDLEMMMRSRRHLQKMKTSCDKFGSCYPKKIVRLCWCKGKLMKSHPGLNCNNINDKYEKKKRFWLPLIAVVVVIVVIVIVVIGIVVIVIGIVVVVAVIGYCCYWYCCCYCCCYWYCCYYCCYWYCCVFVWNILFIHLNT